MRSLESNMQYFVGIMKKMMNATRMAVSIMVSDAGWLSFRMNKAVTSSNDEGKNIIILIQVSVPGESS